MGITRDSAGEGVGVVMLTLSRSVRRCTTWMYDLDVRPRRRSERRDADRDGDRGGERVCGCGWECPFAPSAPTRPLFLGLRPRPRSSNAGEAGFWARPAFEDERVQCDTGVWGQRP